MNRRGFFGILAALPLVGLLPKRKRFSIRKNPKFEWVILRGPDKYGMTDAVKLEIVRAKPGTTLLPKRLYKIHALSKS